MKRIQMHVLLLDAMQTASRKVFRKAFIIKKLCRNGDMCPVRMAHLTGMPYLIAAKSNETVLNHVTKRHASFAYPWCCVTYLSESVCSSAFAATNMETGKAPTLT